jgi:hypothetical protein
MFPLQDEDGEPAEPVTGPDDDPYCDGEYAGYASCVPCGRHDAQGSSWRDTLREEITYLQQARQIPLLGAPGHTVDELLAQLAKKNPA